ncbi:MAG: hypothetical protein JO057_06375 [Chloroflexi bacterium]|nr:hypothetical protein [Chloroflexota bacterium]
MDIVLLGAAAIVLLLLTIWIVWRPSSSDVKNSTQETSPMMPQGDNFEDQYTSATADLSAGGIAVTTASSEEPADASLGVEMPASERQVADTGAATPSIASQFSTTPPWPADTIATEGSATGYEPIRRAPADDVATSPVTPKRIGIGAATLLTIGAAIGGAWLYARIQRERNKPLNRLRRRFR